MIKPEHEKTLSLLRKVKTLARQYYEITKRPLGVTAEVAEYEAARLLDLTLAPVRTPGYDAIERRSSGDRKIQIKGRCVGNASKAGRLGAIKLDHKWDAVLLVLLDRNYETIEIYEGKRAAVEKVLQRPGSRARNERGQLSVAEFRSISKRVWPK